jgi:hypothetical protein
MPPLLKKQSMVQYAPTPTSVCAPTCAATMVSASHCVGLTFPGMMLDPGSFSGSCSSPRPHLAEDVGG